MRTTTVPWSVPTASCLVNSANQLTAAIVSYSGNWLPLCFEYEFVRWSILTNCTFFKNCTWYNILLVNIIEYIPPLAMDIKRCYSSRSMTSKLCSEILTSFFDVTLIVTSIFMINNL